MTVALRRRALLGSGLSIDRRPEDATGSLARRGYSVPAGVVTPAFARQLPKPRGLPVTVARGRDGRRATSASPPPALCSDPGLKESPP